MEEDDDKVLEALGKKLGASTSRGKLAREFEKDFGPEFLDFLDEPTQIVAEQEKDKERTTWAPPSSRAGGLTVEQKVTRVLNRASDATLEASAREMIALYDEYPAARVNQVATAKVLEACVARAKRTDDALAPTYAALVTAVHFGSKRDLGFFVLSKLSEETSATSVCFVARLCDLGLLSGKLAMSLAESLEEPDLAVRVIDVAYERIKADAPERLRAFGFEASTPRESHARRHLSELRRRPKSERSHKLRASIRRVAKTTTALDVEWKDVVGKAGSWWRVGAAFEGGAPRPEIKQDGLEALASTHRMGTPARKAAFVAVMSARDPADGVLRCDELSRLKASNVRDVATVTLHCCGSEARYNAFYAEFLAQWLKEDVKPRAFAVKLAAWDAIKTLRDPRTAANLGKLVGAVVLGPGIVGVADLFKPLDPERALTDLSIQTFATTALRPVLESPVFDRCLAIAAPKVCDDQTAGVLAFISAKFKTDVAAADDRKQRLYQAILEPRPDDPKQRSKLRKRRRRSFFFADIS